MRVLITGANGFVGRELVRCLLARGSLRGQAIDSLLLLDRELEDLPADPRLRQRAGSVTDAALKQMTTVGSSFGALEKRIDLQNDFAKSLTDSYTSGIGRLVDADMEEESGRLAALQTQRQLGIQSLQIANASYNTITQLFQNI